MRNTTKTSVPASPPASIDPLGVYTPGQLAALLGLAKSTLRAERRAGRLRIGKRGNKFYLMGSWVLEWLEAGELPSRTGGAAVDSPRRPNQGG